MASWLEYWHSGRIPNCQRFTLTTQTAAALIRTLRCHALLIENLLDEGYEFVLTARFQSDPLERRYGQYRQMNGGRFLVGLKDTVYSEKILKIKSLVKEGIDIDENVKENRHENMEIDILLLDVDSLNVLPNRIQLTQESREVAVHVAGYVAKRFLKSHACCKSHLTGIISESNPDHAYITILNRGGLTIPSTSLTDYVCTSFAILSFTENSVIKSNIRARKAAELVLSHTFGIYQDFTCNDHRALGQTFVNRIISNIFFNNKRKATTSSVHKDNVVSFKKRQREK